MLSRLILNKIVKDKSATAPAPSLCPRLMINQSSCKPTTKRLKL